MPADRILITGATGCVGAWAVAEAVTRGFQVRALVRDESRAHRTLGELAADIEILVGDFCEPQVAATAVAGQHYVINCAAAVGHGRQSVFTQVNVEALRMWAHELAVSRSLKRFVHLSSLGVYPLKDHFGTDEQAPLNAGIDDYTASKVASENLIKQFVPQLPYTILRPGFIYGPGDRQVVPRLVQRLRRGMVPYVDGGLYKLNNTFVGNVVAAIFQAMCCPEAERQTFNITDSRLVSRKEFFEVVAQGLGLPAPKWSVPRRLLQLATPVAIRLQQWLAKSAGEDPFLSPAVMKFLAFNLEFSTAKARRVFGYAPPFEFDEGMALALAAIHKEGGAGEPT